MLLFVVLGWQWILLPGLIMEAIPGLYVFPFWVLLVGAVAVWGSARPNCTEKIPSDETVKNMEKAYERYRVMLGKALLLGLELLVAADIIRTIVLDATLMNFAVLGVLVVVRTLLGWTLKVEVEGHWPWQSKDE